MNTSDNVKLYIRPLFHNNGMSIDGGCGKYRIRWVNTNGEIFFWNRSSNTFELSETCFSRKELIEISDRFKFKEKVVDAFSDRREDRHLEFMESQKLNQ